MFEIRLDEVFQSDLANKIVNIIERIGRPTKIVYDDYDDWLKHYTARLIYKGKEDERTMSSK